MNDLGRGVVLFSALLSPLAMADWLLNVNLELSSAGYRQSVATSIQLLPGEETVIFGTTEGEQRRKFFGSAELLEVSAEEVKIKFKIQEQLDDGAWRILAAPVISTGLDTPASFESSQDDELNSVKLQVAVMSA
ncbi:hypothetical protein L6J37_08605 [Photobacterium sp. WH77]|uniref:Uncharacterized protein n=1 Tax=Photobacterium arenosum TaxID=2774143 RepID=A0ABR9BH94_9GAMM|nr:MULTISPECIES: hypothetical protein [Photobacterium]MBD8511812.1 hypothetical protein [Photobacterium arenosum]MBV7261484.1 hypothetical protein [Photobacterium sp. WH24]MCG2836887.1 hypothetical protein [Photobacterium sp. WH77]MCG2844504.1 hypothetical protein [Photobacterium sp. WH80]MDO6581713.1 hypothetical protein [Photobacterium sp. 2_MG-2023]